MTPIGSNREWQRHAQQAYRRLREEEAALLEGFVAAGEVRICSLGVLSPAVRTQLLAWIGACNSSRRHRIRTTEGVLIRLKTPGNGERALLRCTDGDLEMPDYTLVFTVADAGSLETT